jgi:hypothetical protein
MINMLGHHVNKPVLVSIPSIFPDGEPQACTLIGIEPAGLWLESEELTRTLFPDTESEKVRKVFVPFAQIGYLVEGTTEPPVSSPLDKATSTPPSSSKKGASVASRAKKRR